MRYLFEFIGYFAGVCTTISFLPQAIKTYKTRDVSGLSIGTYVVYNLGLMCWFIYGWYLKSIQMMFFNALGLVFTLPILYMVIIGHKKQK